MALNPALPLLPMVTPSRMPLLLVRIGDASVLVMVPFLIVPPLSELKPPVPNIPALPMFSVLLELSRMPVRLSVPPVRLKVPRPAGVVLKPKLKVPPV